MTVPRVPLAAADANGAIRVTTERKQRERAIHELADRYDAITSTTTDGFWEVDRQGRILVVNDEACRMSGYSRDELLGMSIRDLEAAQTPLEVRRTIAQVAARGQSHFQSRHRRKDGSVMDVEISTTSLPDMGTFLVFVRDVTERTRAQARLQELLEFNHTILASLVDQIVILDREGTILAINDAWERSALERGGPEALARCGVGVSYLEVCRRASDWAGLEGIESVLRRRRDFHRSEYVAQAPMETRWYLMEVMPLRRAEGGAVVVHRDITVNKRAQAELEQLRMGNWHAHRVAQVGAIAASLAHELNQPLAAILSNAQAGSRLMAAPEPDLGEIRAILADIVHDDKRAAAVISGLRAMLRRKETQRERLDLVALVREGLVLAHSELIAHGVEVELRAAPACFVSADSAQVEQVILNLVMNAVEAMDGLPPERRRLTISVGPASTDEVVLAFRDRGPGVPQDQQAKLFAAFWTTKKHGMGVGLPICRSIIESHGGHLWFANNDDQGVTFFVSLPLSPPGDREP